MAQNIYIYFRMEVSKKNNGHSLRLWLSLDKYEKEFICVITFMAVNKSFHPYKTILSILSYLWIVSYILEKMRVVNNINRYMNQACGTSILGLRRDMDKTVWKFQKKIKINSMCFACVQVKSAKWVYLGLGLLWV